MNLKHSWQKLKAVIAANFSPSDLVVTLTYSDEVLPKNRKDAEKRLKAFIRRLRAERRSCGRELPYLYVTEMGHSSGRLHHHMILEGADGDLELIKRLWTKNGTNVDLRYIKDKGFDGWARYLSKEPLEMGRRYVGERMWRSSLGLNKPIVHAGWVSGSLDISDFPPGSFIIDHQTRNNGYGEFTYIEVILPTGTSEDSLALISDLR